MKLGIISLATASLLFQSAQASVIAPVAARWWTGHPRVIQVCLGQASEQSWVYSLPRPETLIPVSPEMSTLISATLAREYSTQTTGIEFNIKGSCQELAKNEIDAVLFVGNERFTNYEGITGYTGFPQNSAGGSLLPYLKIILSQPTSFAVATHSVVRFAMKMEDQFKITLIHEFGHLVGLAHEQNRSEASLDLNCKLLPKAHQKPGHDYGNATLPGGYEAFGAYDSSSIMNYCNEAYLKTNALTGGVHLSDGDRSALRHLYPSL